MHAEETSLEQVERYLDGKMPAEEKKEYERRLQEDPELAQWHRQTAELIGGIRYAARNQLKNRLQQLEHSSRAKQPPGTGWAVYRKPAVWRAVAASLLILLAVAAAFWFMQPPTGEALFADHFDPYPNVVKPTQRGENDANSLLEKAYWAYDRQQFATAADYFAQVPQERKTPATLLYQGNALLASGETEKAIAAFEMALQQGDEFKPPTHWFLALAYLKNNQEDAAIQQLNILAQGNSSYKERAKRLIDRLN